MYIHNNIQNSFIGGIQERSSCCNDSAGFILALLILKVTIAISFSIILICVARY